MSASRPPPPPARPWYLMLALGVAWIYGAHALSEGYDAIASYRGDHPDVHAYADAVANPAARQAVLDAGERMIAAKDAARTRELPIGVASLLLGAAMVLFSARSMAGREGARHGLIQVVTVHAGVVVAAFFLLRDVARAESEMSLSFAQGVTHGIGDPAAQELARRLQEAAARAAAPVALAFRTLVSTMIVFALTRRRARAYFQEAEPLGEG